MKSQSAAKHYGKYNEFIKLSSVLDETTKLYNIILQCKKCSHEKHILSSGVGKVVCMLCQKNERINRYIGITINNLSVKSYSHSIGRRNYYNCMCNVCNSNIIKAISSNTNKTFNCKHCIIAGKKPKIQSQFNAYFSKYKFSAKRRNIDFDISFEVFSNLIVQNCFYCGEKPKEKYYTNLRSARKDFSFFMNGIDRKNNSKGYEIDNYVPCCSICNKMKIDLDENVFKEKITQIYNYQNEGSTTIPEEEVHSSEWKKRIS